MPRCGAAVATVRGGTVSDVLYIGLIGGILLTVYLFVALVLPERF